MNSSVPHDPQPPQLAVYRPRFIRRDALALVSPLIFFCLNVRTWHQFFWATGVVLAISLAVYVPWRWYELRHYGPRGKPLAALRGDVLFFSHPGLFQRSVEMPLAELEKVLIYGVPGERRFRFMGKDGKHQDLQPPLGRELEAPVIQFFKTALAAKVKVEVKEPPSFFERTRGDDGP